MSIVKFDPLEQAETTCGTLLYELKIIWDEVGETDTDRDKMLFELEQECLEVYRRKVDQANRCRAQLRQAIADSEADLAAICSAMGERPVHIRQSDQIIGSLKEELKKIVPQLEEMRKRKSERRNQFLEVLEEIRSLSNEVLGSTGYVSSTVVDETDLSLRRLEELHKQLQALQKEKSDRLKLVQDHLCTLNSLCSVLGMDFKQTVTEIHPSLVDSGGSKNISNVTIELLATGIQRLREVKIQRMQRLQDLATSMLELWNLMDTPIEEQQMFQNVTCNIAASEVEITEPNTLSVDFINYVEAEVSRLEELKASKMKELVLKKRSELEEICRKTHMVLETDSALDCAIEALESGAVDPGCILEQIELQVGKVKEEAFGRKDILERVEKWLFACNEECWLEEYNRDDNRYNAGRGAHITLKRAEKARALVNKLPGMVEALASKTVAWEREKGCEFTYDGVRLLSMLEEYNILRQEKEQERRRQRDQKKLQVQLIAEQEAIYGSKPSPSKPSAKKAPRMSTGGANNNNNSNRRLSLGGAMIQTPKPASRPGSRKSERSNQPDLLNNHFDESVTALSTARRGLDVAGIPIRNQSFGAREVEVSPMKRKPFSPISTTTTQAKTNNIATNNNFQENDDAVQKTTTLPFMPFTTPSKTTSSAFVAAEEENKTPRAFLPIPVPSTPFTVSVPMQTAPTPGPQLVIPYGSNKLELVPEEIEYSFEERRAGYVLSKSHLKSTIQV